MRPFSECQGYGVCFSTASFDKAESTFNFFKQHIFKKFLNLTTLKIHINMIEFSRVTVGEKWFSWDQRLSAFRTVAQWMNFRITPILYTQKSFLLWLEWEGLHFLSNSEVNCPCAKFVQGQVLGNILCCNNCTMTDNLFIRKEKKILFFSTVQ